MKKDKELEKDFQHKLSRSLLKDMMQYAVEDLNLQECPEGCILGKVCRIMGMGSFCPCWDTNWKSGKHLYKGMASSKI